jgi:predicted metal-binding protein
MYPGRPAKEKTAMAAERKMRQPSIRTVKEEEIQRDLERFRQKALELGASAAEVIAASQVVVQERVWLKCLVPLCNMAGTNPHCPPSTPQPDLIRKALSQYRWAVLFKRDIEHLEKYFATSAAKQKEQPGLAGARGFHRKTAEIVGRLEAYAQTEGYDLAMGFSCGSCRVNLCNRAPCDFIEKGKCRFPLLARPSMEGVGIDVFDLCHKVGWDTYMIRTVEPDLSVIPAGVSVGIVFIY